MGAVGIWIKCKGKTMTDAFNKAQEEAKEEHGHEQGYSGAINSCELVADRTYSWKNASDKKQFLADLQDGANKRDVYGICLIEPVLSKLKTKTKVTRIPQKGARVFQTVYTAYDFMGDTEVIKPQKLIALAIKEARLWSEKNDRRCSVYTEKRLVKGNACCAQIEVKQDSKKKDGVYLFIGQAPE